MKINDVRRVGAIPLRAPALSDLIGETNAHKIQNNTSTPVVRTGVIPTCRSPSLPALASLSHGPRDCPASLSHPATDRPMHYRFFTFWPRGLTPGPKFTKSGEDLVAS